RKRANQDRAHQGDPAKADEHIAKADHADQGIIRTVCGGGDVQKKIQSRIHTSFQTRNEAQLGVSVLRLPDLHHLVHGLVRELKAERGQSGCGEFEYLLDLSHPEVYLVDRGKAAILDSIVSPKPAPEISGVSAGR